MPSQEVRSHEGRPLLPKAESSNDTTASPLSTSLRIATNVLALTSVFLFSGIIFGWAPLELVLLEEGQYQGLCGDGGGDDGSCPAQLNRLHALFVWAQFWLSFSSLPVGFLLDHTSKPIFFMVTGIIECTGLLLFAISDTNDDGDSSRDYFGLGYSLMAIGGCMTMLSSFPASFLLPSLQAGILSSISCLFDASSIVFSAMKQLVDRWEIADRSTLFGWYTFVAIGIYTSLALCWYQLERLDWQNVLEQEANRTPSSDAEDGDASASTLAGDGNAVDWHKRRVEQLELHSKTAWEQLQTYDYLLAVVYISVQMLRCNFFIMTVDDFLLQLGDSDQVYANLFAWILPCGIFFVPLIEHVLSNIGVYGSLHCSNLIGLVFGTLLLVPNLKVQAVNFGIFTGFRAFIYATLNTLIALTFGVATMGRMMGCVFTTAAVVSLLQYPLAAQWTQHLFHGNYGPANLLLLGTCVIPIGATIRYGWLLHHTRSSTSSHKSTPKRSSLTVSPSLLLTSPGKSFTTSLRKARRQAEEDYD